MTKSTTITIINPIIKTKLTMITKLRIITKTNPIAASVTITNIIPITELIITLPMPITKRKVIQMIGCVPGNGVSNLRNRVPMMFRHGDCPKKMKKVLKRSRTIWSPVKRKFGLSFTNHFICSPVLTEISDFHSPGFELGSKAHFSRTF